MVILNDERTKGYESKMDKKCFFMSIAAFCLFAGCGTSKTEETNTTESVFTNETTKETSISDSTNSTLNSFEENTNVEESSSHTNVNDDAHATGISDLFVTEIREYEIQKCDSLEAYEKQHIDQWGYSEEKFESADAFVKSLDLANKHYTYGNILAELWKNNISYTTFHNTKKDTEKAISFSDDILVLEDGTKLYFMNQLGNKDIFHMQNFTNAQYYEALWKVNDTVDYSFFQTNQELVYYVNNGFMMDTTMLLWDSSFELWLKRNYFFAKYGYTFDSPELDAFFRMFDWYQPKYTKDEINTIIEKEFTQEEKDTVEFIKGLEAEKTPVKFVITPNHFTSYVSGSSLDVDGDGALEQVYSFVYTDDSPDFDSGVDLFVKEKDGTIASGNFEMEYGRPNAVFEHTLTENGAGFFLLGGHVESAAYEYAILGYEDQDLSMLDHFGAYFIESFDGNILVQESLYNHFESMNVDVEYELTPSGFEMVKKDFYPYVCAQHIAKKDIYARASNSESSEEMIIHENDVIQILGGDLEEWIKFENVTTNETGWLKVRDTTVELQETSELTMDLFEGVNIHD